MYYKKGFCGKLNYAVKNIGKCIYWQKKKTDWTDVIEKKGG
jgi:hypothetical protein